METNNINYEDYIGREVKGFKFEDSDKLNYSPDMDDCIGDVGTIVNCSPDRDFFKIEFEDDFWYYPADLVIKQLEQKESLVEIMGKDEEAGIYEDDDSEPDLEGINPQKHYDNTYGSLYKVAENRGWNSYQFDIVKRIDRALKKGQFEEDLKKTKDLIDLWLREYEN